VSDHSSGEHPTPRESTTREAAAAQWLRAAASITVLTGAGISTESGIPDFRGPQGVWTKNPGAQALSSIDVYLADPDVRRRAWQARLDHPAWSARPNAGHRALADLERAGRLRALVTQNIDGLHQAAGSSPDLVIEIHGTIRQVACLSCGDRIPMVAALERVAAGEDDPPCRKCGGILKSATISFGQALEPAVLTAAISAAQACDVLLAVGTSLSVYPAAGLCDFALGSGAKLVIINAEPTPYDHVAHAVLREPIGTVLPRLVQAAVADGEGAAR
jgi:NAD-dependent deacetylase